jgi:hypothetical protein
MAERLAPLRAMHAGGRVRSPDKRTVAKAKVCQHLEAWVEIYKWHRHWLKAALPDKKNQIRQI